MVFGKNCGIEGWSDFIKWSCNPMIGGTTFNFFTNFRLIKEVSYLVGFKVPLLIKRAICLVVPLCFVISIVGRDLVQSKNIFMVERGSLPLVEMTAHNLKAEAYCFYAGKNSIAYLDTTISHRDTF